MAAILANCRGYKIKNKVDGTVSRVVLQSSEDIEKYKNCMRLRLVGDKKANKYKPENIAKIVFLRG